MELVCVLQHTYVNQGSNVVLSDFKIYVDDLKEMP